MLNNRPEDIPEDYFNRKTANAKSAVLKDDKTIACSKISNGNLDTEISV